MNETDPKGGSLRSASLAIADGAVNKANKNAVMVYPKTRETFLKSMASSVIF